MTDYVVVLTEKYDLLHLQLLDARQLIDKNHIVIERDKVEKGAPKCRSVSLVCPPTSTPEERRMSLQQLKQEEKGRQGEGGEVGVVRAQALSQGGGEESPPVSSSPPAAGPPVRKRTKKCSMFETIEENQDCPPSALITSPRKSSKKVSIAENLNCDYSDCEYSEVMGETGGDSSLEEEDDAGSSSARSLTTFFLELVVTLIFVLVSYTLSYPRQAAVIFLSFLIIYLMLMIIS